jgi:hypothetical protein
MFTSVRDLSSELLSAPSPASDALWTPEYSSQHLIGITLKSRALQVGVFIQYGAFKADAKEIRTAKVGPARREAPRKFVQDRSAPRRFARSKFADCRLAVLSSAAVSVAFSIMVSFKLKPMR